MAQSHTVVQSAQSDFVVGSVRAVGHGDARLSLIEDHSAHGQPTAALAEGRRTDREYPMQFPDAENPEWWPEGRGVPDYRPLNRNVDRSLRPWGSNPAEINFVRSMLTGVYVLGTANYAWRSTFGKVMNVWEYPIGGRF